MKSKLVLLLLFIGSSSFAGPLVSAGGMPKVIKCQSDEAKLQVTILGPRGNGLVFLDAANPQKGIEVSCEVVNQPLLQQVNAKLAYVCGNQALGKFVKIYREIDGIKTWALVLSKTPNGVIDPISLGCTR